MPEKDLSFSKQFAVRIKELRIKAGLSQVDVAVLLGITQNAISSWERGICAPKIDTCQKLAILYKLKEVRDILPNNPCEPIQLEPNEKNEVDQSQYSGRFAARLRELRIAAGLSQTEIAKSLNVTRAAVSSWELGKTEPAIEFWPLLASLYNLSNTNLIFPKK